MEIVAVVIITIGAVILSYFSSLLGASVALKAHIKVLTLICDELSADDMKRFIRKFNEK